MPPVFPTTFTMLAVMQSLPRRTPNVCVGHQVTAGLHQALTIVPDDASRMFGSNSKQAQKGVEASAQQIGSSVDYAVRI